MRCCHKQARSASKLGKSDRRDWEAGDTTQHLASTPGQVGDTEPASQHLASNRRDSETQGDETGRHRETSADTTPEPASQHLASDRETGRHRETSVRPPRSRCHGIWRQAPGASVTASQRLRDTGRQAGDTTPEPASQHLRYLTAETGRQAGNDAGGRRDKTRLAQGDKRRQPRSRRHSIWPLTAEAGRHREAPQPASQRLRQAGDTTPEPASQHLASDRRDWETQGDKQETRETQGDKRETRPLQHLASDRRDWETGRQAENTTPETASHFPILYTSS